VLVLACGPCAAISNSGGADAIALMVSSGPVPWALVEADRRARGRPPPTLGAISGVAIIGSAS
jgi:hypothetical protein